MTKSVNDTPPAFPYSLVPLPQRWWGKVLYYLCLQLIVIAVVLAVSLIVFLVHPGTPSKTDTYIMARSIHDNGRSPWAAMAAVAAYETAPQTIPAKPVVPRTAPRPAVPPHTAP